MQHLWDDEEALTTVEYGLLLALLVVAGLLAWEGLGETVRSTVNTSSDTIVDAGN